MNTVQSLKNTRLKPFLVGCCLICCAIQNIRAAQFFTLLPGESRTITASETIAITAVNTLGTTYNWTTAVGNCLGSCTGSLGTSQASGTTRAIPDYSNPLFMAGPGTLTNAANVDGASIEIIAGVIIASGTTKLPLMPTTGTLTTAFRGMTVTIPAGVTGLIVSSHPIDQLNSTIGRSPSNQSTYLLMASGTRKDDFPYGQAKLASPFPITGPMTLIFPLSTASAGAGPFTMLMVNSTFDSDTGYLNSNYATVPSDATGPVRVILETSTNLLNWSPANPGVYGATNPAQFFRVRTVNETP